MTFMENNELIIHFACHLSPIKFRIAMLAELGDDII